MSDNQGCMMTDPAPRGADAPNLREWARDDRNVSVLLSTGIEIELRSYEMPQGTISVRRAGDVHSTYWKAREIRNADEFAEVILDTLIDKPTTDDRAKALAWYANLERAGRPSWSLRSHVPPEATSGADWMAWADTLDHIIEGLTSSFIREPMSNQALEYIDNFAARLTTLAAALRTPSAPLPREGAV